MIVVVEGPHGVGKTTVINALRDKGHKIVEEHYMDLCIDDFDPQGIVCEMRWMASWCFHVKSLHKRSKLLITDRSPLSAAVYTKHAAKTFSAMSNVARAAMEEVGKVKIIKLTGDTEQIYARIVKRLENEPERAKFNENNKEHLLNVSKMYDEMHADVTICTTDLAVEAVVQKVLSAIEVLVHEVE